MENDSDLARQLLSLARGDAATAETMAENEEVLDRVIGFHAQQAVEKALKAVLASAGIEFPLTHDLAVLIEFCEEAQIAIPVELDEVDRLTSYAVMARYGVAVSGGVDRNRAQAWASRAVAWSNSYLQPEVDATEQADRDETSRS